MPRRSTPTDGHAIRRYREQAGLGLVEFAEQVRLSHGYLSRIENGANASAPTLRRIAEALGVTVRDLVPAEERMPLRA